MARRRTTFQFEKALQELEALVETLEQGELPLEESLKQFEKGIQLTRQCQEALDAAEQRVEILMQEKGTPEPFEGAEEE
ncbi:MAG TPA: exodeoxyribonuclease VII small subunit [Thiotrichales bacterium]|nr:exodeoxyribonuclease VII small subunit [Thiotrichales bacterium]